MRIQILAMLAAGAGFVVSPGAAMAVPAHRAAHTAGVADPRAFVAERYAAYQRGTDHIPPEPVWAYSPRLRALYDGYNSWARRHGDEVGLDFDWWINAQDWQLTDVSVTAADTGPLTRTVTAHWRNSGTADGERFLFVRLGSRWYLDDIVHAGQGDENWTFSTLLRNRH